MHISFTGRLADLCNVHTQTRCSIVYNSLICKQGLELLDIVLINTEQNEHYIVLEKFIATKWNSKQMWMLVNKKKINSMVWVRERTIPTERPPLVGEVIPNFCG
jgi:hypothetical protein